MTATTNDAHIRSYIVLLLMRPLSKADVIRFLASDNPARIRFALEMSDRTGIEDEFIYRVLETAERDNAKLALQVLIGRLSKPEVLDMQLAHILRKTCETAEWVILDFLEKRGPCDPHVHEVIESALPQLSFIGKRKAQFILR